jgi:hypothetical protein
MLGGAFVNEISVAMVGVGLMGSGALMASRTSKPDTKAAKSAKSADLNEIEAAIDERQAAYTKYGTGHAARVRCLRMLYLELGGAERLWAWEDAMDEALGLQPGTAVVDGRVVMFRYGVPDEYKQPTNRVDTDGDGQPDTTLLDIKRQLLAAFRVPSMHMGEQRAADVAAYNGHAIQRRGRKQLDPTSARYAREVTKAARAVSEGQGEVQWHPDRGTWTGVCDRCHHKAVLAVSRDLDGGRVAICSLCELALMEIRADVDDRTL